MGLPGDAGRGGRPLPAISGCAAGGLSKRMVVDGERVGLYEGQEAIGLRPLFPYRGGKRSVSTPALDSQRRYSVRPRKAMGDTREHSGRRFHKDARLPERV